ncbi:CRISPR-associated protein Cas4 [Clostridium sp. MSJ-8]|uniref:CRISPR-associated protein Cas4 n=1 Tax=Clostridium sp. MSJ-8 TaxID=2841510 RepID=UPI001C0EC11F|nr:CRISPR-associated protein Cas4 [Clostridium sp. MSJ-8]MBU5487891.1 CRISPR-associated protein Cas4 [Clostridium sp. MSJ-8]
MGKVKITGLDIYYYEVCKRKLWYFNHEISMEQNSEDVSIGKALDEETYSRESKHINIDNVINIDFFKNNKMLHEVKKSKTIEEASIMQVKYYLYYLKCRGVDGAYGKLDYPLLKQTVEVNLTEDDEKNIKDMEKNIINIVNEKVPPQLEKKKICKKCAYFDLCYI